MMFLDSCLSINPYSSQQVAAVESTVNGYCSGKVAKDKANNRVMIIMMAEITGWIEDASGKKRRRLRNQTALMWVDAGIAGFLRCGLMTQKPVFCLN
ncbi:MAG: hypothetical protein HC889_02335 [Synechococcaceae cyanobacterium SM1_2_3]|nr:hypothetical protein [Synechococcaceae cyanobacterium SM1_2_3]